MSHPDKYANLKAEIQAIFEEYEGRYGYFVFEMRWGLVAKR